ncbi:MAG: diguanylate cyclase [Rhodocyclaceae bacterium]
MPEKPPTLLSHDEIEQRIRHALASADDQPNAVCALMFGIVNHDGLSDQFGQEVATELGSRFAQLLLGKIGPQDAIARYSSERLLIVTRGLELKHNARTSPGGFVRAWPRGKSPCMGKRSNSPRRRERPWHAKLA